MYVPKYTSKTPSSKFARVISRLADKCNKPYADFDFVERIKQECDAFLRDPDNDCLRARGDWRWNRVNEAYYTAVTSLIPF